MKRIFPFICIFAFLKMNSSAQNFVALATTIIKQNDPLALKAHQHQFIDEKGNVLYSEKSTTVIAEQIFPFHNGLGRIKRQGKFGYINQFGETVIPIEYEACEDFSEGFAAVKINNKWGFINTKNEIVIQPQYKHVFRFSNGMAGFGENGNYGFLNTHGEVIIKPEYDRICYFHDNKVWVLKNGEWGCLNKKGEMIIAPHYSDTKDFSEGYCWVKKDQLWGLIDSLNNYLIKPDERNPLIYAHNSTFKNFGNFNNGYIISQSNGKYGFSDKSLKKIKASTFDEVKDFEKGFALVKLNKKWGVIDSAFNIILDPKYDNINYLNHHMFAIQGKHGNWGIINLKGEQITDFIYHTIYEFEELKK